MSEYPKPELVKELFDEYKQMMYRMAFDILHNKSDAEDIVHEAFLWIINNYEKISQLPCNKRGCYFANIVEHKALNLIYKRRKHSECDIDDNLEIQSNISVDKDFSERETIEAVKQAIRTMSEKDRLLLRLYLFDEKSYKEIAELAGISEGNARTAVFRAKKRLAKLLKERGIDYE